VASDTSNGFTFSAAGQALGFGSTASGESDEDRRKRLQAIAQAQNKLSAGSNYSAAGHALLSYGGGGSYGLG
jgi:hypothetical protein